MEITEHLFLGDDDDASDEDLLKRLNITRIVNCARECENYFENAQFGHLSKIKYKKVDVEDSEDTRIFNHFFDVHDFIDASIESKRNVLVHCRLGKSRSPTFILAYLMRKFKMKYDETMNFLKERVGENHIIKINPAFQNQLIELHRLLFPEDTRMNYKKNRRKLVKRKFTFEHPTKRTRIFKNYQFDYNKNVNKENESSEKNKDRKEEKEKKSKIEVGKKRKLSEKDNNSDLSKKLRKLVK